jgi:hypothetical protein
VSPTARIRLGSSPSAPFTLLGLAVPLVIGLSEKVVVLLDLTLPRLQLQGLLVRLARTGEVALLLAGHRQVVQRGGVPWVQLHGLLETEAGLSPEALLRDLDAEAHLGRAGRGHDRATRREGEDRHADG